MKILISLLLSMGLISSCASINKENKNFIQDVMNIEDNSNDNITSQIKLREEEITKINMKIAELNNFLAKLSQRVDFDNKFVSDSSSMQKYLEDTNQELNKYKLKCQKLKREISVLRRRL